NHQSVLTLKAAGSHANFRRFHCWKAVVNLPPRAHARVRYLLEGTLPFRSDSNTDLGWKQIDIIEAEPKHIGIDRALHSEVYFGKAFACGRKIGIVGVIEKLIDAESGHACRRRDDLIVVRQLVS